MTPPEPDAPSVSRAAGIARVLRDWVPVLAAAAAILVVGGRLRAPALPERAPDFTLTTVEGEALTLSSLRGRPVVLNFWATWCGPCRVELPMLAAWADAHPDVTVVGVSIDDDPDALTRFLAGSPLPYPVVRDTALVKASYGVSSVPTTVYLDAEGRVRGAHTGLVFGPMIDLLAW